MNKGRWLTARLNEFRQARGRRRHRVPLRGNCAPELRHGLVELELGLLSGGEVLGEEGA
jgi:hypothetical protein